MNEIAARGSDISSEDRIAGALGSIGLDGSQAIYAFKVMLAGGLTMFLAFLVDLPYTYWALLTLPLVVTEQSGTTVWRSAARVGGTLTGAIVALAFVALFAQNGLVMILCLALWIFGCGYNARTQTGLDGYAYGTAGLTALVVAIDTGPNADMAFSYAYWRSTETIIAVIASFIVLLTIFPRSVRNEVVDGFETARSKVFDLVRDAVARDEEQTAEARLGAATALRGLFTLIRAQKLERNHLGPEFTRVRTATARLNALYIDSGALSVVVARTRGHGDLAEDVRRARSRFAELVEDIPSAREDPEAVKQRVEELRRYTGELERSEGMRKAALGEDAKTRIEGLLVYRLRENASALASYLEAALAVADPTRSALPDRSFSTRYPDLSAAVQRGLRPAAAFLAMALFWIFSAWSNGSILALITGALSLLIPTILPRAALSKAGIKIFLGFVSGGTIAFMMMMVLPSVTSFGGFLAVFMPVIFVIFYLCKGANRALAIGSTIMIAIALQPANDQSYDALRLFNSVLTLTIMPAAFISAMLVVLPEDTTWLRRHLGRAGTNLMRSAAYNRTENEETLLAQAIDVTADYGGDLQIKEPGDAHLVSRAKAIAHAGREMLTVNRMRRTGHLPDDISALVPKVREAIVAATKRRIGEDTSGELAVFENARRSAGERLSGFEGPSVERTATLRFALAMEQLATLVVEERIGLMKGQSR
ncbi:FUSC family protein [Fulvimarina endophytica]|uniref:FUSC family protein n=1 Tax=Fulvimarina endophytica TaxID=2293836 RepID=A0A371X7V4_9HYPH|nr:FUSC family protein [Fulvimarina endophytica]RFC65302.1 FUSC family protein [Fulvimarina endophytica]